MMEEPIPGTSKDDFSVRNEDDDRSAVAEKTLDQPSISQQQPEHTSVPIKRPVSVLDPFFEIVMKEDPFGINNRVEQQYLSIIESDFAALVLSGDKQIIRNGRVVKSYKVSGGNRHHCVLKTPETEKREMNYLSHISKKSSSIKKVKHMAHTKTTSQKAILKQSLLNCVVSNERFSPRKPMLTFFPGTDDAEDGNNQQAKWMNLKSCNDENSYSSVCTSDGIPTSSFKSLVRSSSAPKEKSGESLNVPAMLKSWNRDCASNVIWKAAAIKSYGQRNSALQQTCPAADDITMNDLAGYFDNLVHIPKEMSSMAKMMYQ